MNDPIPPSPLPEPPAAATPPHLEFKATLLLVALLLMVGAAALYLSYARGAFEATQTLVLVADDLRVAALAALDLAEAGCGDVAILKGGVAAWSAENRPLVSTPGEPADGDCIDFVFHTLGRNEGNLDAARAYLAWEVGLVDQLDADERASFRL